MARSATTLSALPDLMEIHKAPQRARIVQLLQEGHQLKQGIDDANSRLTEIKSELAQIQLLDDLPGLRYGQYCFVAVEREGKSILNRELLIDNGCPPELIAASMKKGSSYIETRLELIKDKE